MEVRVMTYNIHHGQGTDGVINLHRIADVITQSGADIIALNEVDRHFSKRSDFVDQTAWLAAELQMNAYYGPAITLKAKDKGSMRQYGNALLSRYPIATADHQTFHSFSKLSETRSAIDAIILIQQHKLLILASHLSLNPYIHKRQTDWIVQKAGLSDVPAIVLGDWNMKPASRPWKKVSSTLSDVWQRQGQGLGFTYPSHAPASRIDYIFADPRLQVRSIEVLSTIPKASDHLPVLAIFSLY